MLTEKDLNSLCKTAKRAAIAAGEYIQSQFDQHYQKEQKESGDSLASQVVTAVDFKAQEIILQQLNDHIKQYDLGVLTEEAADDASRLKKDYFWCIDPLDGTLAFTQGRTGYAVSIALVSKSGDPLIGVVYIPDLGDCYTCIKGKGLLLNDKAFKRNTGKADVLKVYMDRSLQSTPYFDLLKKELQIWTDEKEKKLEYQLGYGAVRNAIAVLNNPMACYFKFPKKKKGGGSIWDFAATRLFFEELGLIVTDGFGKQLYLNNPKSTFMNQLGVLYATDPILFDFVVRLGYQINEL
ncbi:3'(2'),5'-bisphosphate nucleotidase CysQ family protein [Marivirga harenae]|uniref:3'(2'),5'-bisphosphate nucleotidase CysQ family protein n=1 Tax=Marivirga harenae TaxID=2010992 RepID=UPI0026DFBBF3|nr:inositol monophosphatase family protein [Marivirga harenae]WKV11429.1 inositol monophosphatase family protein [Marivirga harenae]